MSKHTPGDWFVDHTPERALSIFDSATCGILIAEIAGEADHPEVEANAILIRAAPELLEACRLAILRLDQLDDSGDIGPSENYKAILAAIEKATNP